MPGGVSEQEEVQVQVTRLLVESYFDVVRKNLQDAVPKAVMHFLVNSVQRGLQQHLIRTLYRWGHPCCAFWVMPKPLSIQNTRKNCFTLFRFLLLVKINR